MIQYSQEFSKNDTYFYKFDSKKEELNTEVIQLCRCEKEDIWRRFEIHTTEGELNFEIISANFYGFAESMFDDYEKNLITGVEV